MDNVVEVIDCSALVLPGVGGRHQEVPAWVATTIFRLNEVLAAAQTRELGITVIAEWATEIPKTAGPVVTDLGTYQNANYRGIYGALGLQAPPELATGPAVLIPESLGHAVIRYLVGQAASAQLDHANISVSLIEISQSLSNQERTDLLQRAARGHLVLIASHGPNGDIAAGMSQGRQDVQREIAKIILGTLKQW